MHQKNRGDSDHEAPPKSQSETAPVGPNDDRGIHGRGTADTEQNLDQDMEIELNPVFPNPDLTKQSTAEIFNAQLKEIDQAINYIPFVEKTNDQFSG